MKVYILCEDKNNPVLTASEYLLFYKECFSSIKVLEDYLRCLYMDYIVRNNHRILKSMDESYYTIGEYKFVVIEKEFN